MRLSAVVDTSVLVSAFLFPNSIPGQVVDAAKQKQYELHFSSIIIEEFRRSLLNPRLQNAYSYTDDVVEFWCQSLHNSGYLIQKPLPDIESVCRDPDDDHVIAAALAINADYIVTGDKDLLTLVQYQDIQIITAKQFLETVTDNGI